MHVYKFGREDLQRLGILNDPNVEPKLISIGMYVMVNASLEGVLGNYGYDQIEQVNLIELPDYVEVRLVGEGGEAFIQTHGDGKWETISQPMSWGSSNQHIHQTFIIPMLPPYVHLQFTDEQYKQYLGKGEFFSVVTYHKKEEHPVDLKHLVPCNQHPDSTGFIATTGNGFEFKVLYNTLFSFVNHLGRIPGTLARVTATGYELVDENIEDYPIDIHNGVVDVRPDYSKPDGGRFMHPRKDPAQYWMIIEKGVKPSYVASIKPQPYNEVMIQAPYGAVILIREPFEQKALVVCKNHVITVDPNIYLDDPRFELMPIPA